MATRRTLPFLLLTLLLIAGCSTVHMREDSAAPPAYAPDAEYGTQVALGDCAFTRGEEGALLAPIVGALASSAISAGINRIGTALTEASKEKSLSAKTSRNVEVSAKTFGPCIHVVRGWFYQDPLPIAEKGDALAGNAKFAAAQGWLSNDFITRDRLRKLWLQNQLWLAAPPDFLFEGRVAATGKNTLTIVPQYVRMDEPLFTRTLRRDPSRHVAVFFAFHTPETAVDVATNPGATLVIGKLTPGAARTYPAPERIADFTAADRVLNRWPHESDWFTLSLGEQKEPWIVSALVTETQDGNEFLAFVAEVFGGAKDTITEQVQTAVIPAKREAAKETATAAHESALTALDQKEVAALGALADCAQAAPATAQQASAARAAMRELNQAARGAKQAEPVGQACIDSIKITAAADSIKSACDAARAKLVSDRKC